MIPGTNSDYWERYEVLAAETRQITVVRDVVS
jgi:hypothetical protein